MNIRKKIRLFLFSDIWRSLSVSLRYAVGMGNAQKIKRRSSTLRLPVVDCEKCVGCKLCAKICPARAILVQTILQDQTKTIVDFSFSEDKCVSCGLCAESCPEKAVTLEGK